MKRAFALRQPKNALKPIEALENEKKEIAVQIAKEEIGKPLLEKNQIVFWFHRLRKYNVNRLEHRRRLIDSFINSVYLYDDRMVIIFNYKDGSKTVSLSEINKSDISSDSTSCALPYCNASIDTILAFLFFLAKSA